LVRYEDLSSPRTAEAMRNLGLSPNQEAKATRVGSSFAAARKPSLSPAEEHALRRATSVVAEELGYFGPTASG